MIRFSIKILFLVFAFSYIGLTSNYAQDSKVPSGWKKVSICDISFIVPKNLKNNNSQGIDSCVASFSSSKIGLGIDYGWYGSASTKYESYTDFKEESIQIDGKKAQLATYIDTRSNAKRKFVARIYVVLNEPEGGGMTTSLNMTIGVGNEKDLETAKQIFQSIRFDK